MSKQKYQPFTFKPGSKIKLDEIPTDLADDSSGKEQAERQIEKNAEETAALAKKLYAENKQGLLLVLQGMDTAGKDGTIREITRGVNPRSCVVASFKRPSLEELDHDFLWRVHKVVPRKGDICIFNRSHYEDVLVVRVHELVPEKIWKMRYEQINQFEELLSETGTTIVKCFLHISKSEQRKRLQERIDRPEKNWKFNPDDLHERKLWEDYQRAYEDALVKCNTGHAPWNIVPSDRKWYRNLIISELLLSTLRRMDPQFPNASGDFKGIVVE